jgi:large subunit ribosomal protein L3
MPGHMGSQRSTILNLRVVKVDSERNLIFVNGAVPGANGEIISIRPSIKKKQGK